MRPRVHHSEQATCDRIVNFRSQLAGAQLRGPCYGLPLIGLLLAATRVVAFVIFLIRERPDPAPPPNPPSEKWSHARSRFSGSPVEPFSNAPHPDKASSYIFLSWEFLLRIENLPSVTISSPFRPILFRSWSSSTMTLIFSINWLVRPSNSLS